ncbi:MAG: hypothetical protein K0R73_366 [Candidatus Midichloriaceae bacterium]|jgi:hypothetical protein|nr:hypothetical protein [Candidatus Midichloriaceae bacterium]
MQSTKENQIADISNAISIDQILDLYNTIADKALQAEIAKINEISLKYSKAITQREKGPILTALNKYPQMQKAIKENQEIDFSELISTYKKEGSQMLNSQIVAANSFIASNAVQEEVERDFNSGNYKAFDVSNGDNNCQSRVLLMQFFSRDVDYANLNPQDKLVATLAHINGKFQKEIRDEFGLLIKDVNCAKVSYGKAIIPIIKPIAKGLKTDSFYSISDFFAQAMSNISCDFLIGVAESADLKADLKPYNRPLGKSGKLLPAQQLQAPGIEAMYRFIEKNSIPLNYKITRLGSTILEDSPRQYSLQGIRLLDISGKVVENPTKDPCMIFELFSVDTITARESAKGTELYSLASAGAMEEYIKELNIFGIRKLIGASDTKLDEILHGKKVVYATQKFNELSSSGIGNLLNLKYVEGAFRSSKGVILAPCHIYVNSTQNEFTEMQNIINSSPVSGDKYIAR